jgi:hypothetical protein
MWEHIGTHRHFKPGGCRLASGIGDRWSALDRALSRKRSVLEREMIERGFSALVSALMIGILVGAALRARPRTRASEMRRQPL